MASPVKPPTTLPPDFDGWDRTPPKTLPADFDKWDKPALASPSPVVAPAQQPKPFLKGVQDSFDENTRTSPKEPLLETGLKSVVGAIGSPFVHPVQTAAGMLDMIPSSPDLPATPMKANGQTYLRRDNNPIVDRGAQAYHDAKDGGVGYAATKLGGEAFGSLALSAAGEQLPGAARAVGNKLPEIREAAIGDPNAAALRGLRVGPASNKAINTLSAVEGSRAFLQGSQDLASLQARIPLAKSEIWSPYTEAINKVGDKQTRLGTVRELENRRLEVSGQLRALKSGDPQAIALAAQKGLTQADLLSEESRIKSVLDPELRNAGVDPTAIRKAFSQVGTVERRVAGKSTIAENPKPYGLSKLPEVLSGLDVTKPATYLKPIGNLMDAGKDITAGRYTSAKPTDVAIREAFRRGGEKPNFLVATPSEDYEPSTSRYLPSRTGGEASGADYSSGPIPVRPSIVTPSPSQFRRLPAATAAGEAQPMIGMRATPAPGLAEDYARIRVEPNTFAEPQIISPRGYVVSPDGSVKGNPLFLNANEPRGLLPAPLKRKKR